MTTTVQRNYAMTKVAVGDYLLPSNDGRTIWRLAVYQDGPASGLDVPTERNFWGLWRWIGGPDGVDLEDWELWQMEVPALPTRGAAVAEVMRMEGCEGRR